MKLLFATVVLCVLVYVHGESCTTNTDCVATTCATGATVICQHDGDGVVVGGGLCTCADDGAGECVTASDCYGSNAPNLNCQDSARHCYDNVCICDRFPIGRK